MNKWKDTARVKSEIIKKNIRQEEIVIQQGSLFVIEKELPKNKYLVSDTNPNSSSRRQFSISQDVLVLEDYSITRDINIPMLLADGWDAQDLLMNRATVEKK